MKKAKGDSAGVPRLQPGDRVMVPDGAEAEVLEITPERVRVRFLGALPGSGSQGLYPRGVLAGDGPGPDAPTKEVS